jgi:hypothetical protein
MSRIAGISRHQRTQPRTEVKAPVDTVSPSVVKARAPADTFSLQDANPYQVAGGGGQLALNDDVIARYQRPGLAKANPLSARIAAMTGKKTRIESSVILDQVDSHPHRFSSLGEMTGVGGKKVKLPSVAELFPADVGSAKAIFDDTVKQLGEFQVRSAGGGAPSSLLARIERSPLDDTQVSRALECLAEFRNSLDAHRGFDTAGSEVNWKHICGELGQVLDACEAKGLSANATEDAVLASLFSDAVKFTPTLLTHNIDGAIAAHHVLGRRGDLDDERLAGIVRATKEHQIGPPSFMAMIAGFGLGGAGAPDHVVDSIRTKMADPMNKKHVKMRAGGAELDFTPEERKYLDKIGIEEWAVPHPETDWFDASMAVICGDSLVNYASPEGPGKIVMLSGPDSPFPDPTVFHSMFSCGASYVDAGRIIDDKLRPQYEAGAAHTKEVARAVADKMDGELAAGALVFDAATFDANAKADGVDLTKLTVERSGDEVRVQLPKGVKPGEVPFYDVPFDYDDTRPDNHMFAKLIRRRAGDLLRDAAEWFDG